MSKVRVGFIGCGGIARYHAGNLLKMDDVEIVAVYDPVEEQMDKMLAMTSGGRKYSGYLDMYDNAELMPYMCAYLPTCTGDIEVEAAKRGINMYIEKPVATDMETVKKVNQSIEEAGIVTAVGFQDRYLDIIARAKEYIKGMKSVLYTVRGLEEYPAYHGGEKRTVGRTNCGTEYSYY